jgi:phosphoglycerate kinase
MKYIRDIQSLLGVRVIIRVDFNVPIKNGSVIDDFRIKKVLPSINYLKSKGAKIILISHIEPLSGEKVSLEPVCKHLSYLGISCNFIKNYRNALSFINGMNNGDIVLLENLRDNEGEKKNDKAFAKELASLGDVYVNDAFSVSHRDHASISAITDFIPSYAGMLFENEVKYLTSAFNPDRPFLFILGGTKFETKLPLIEKFTNIADRVFVGGALANNFLKENGVNIGKSMVSDKVFGLDKLTSTGKIILPIDAVVMSKGRKEIKEINNIGNEDNILDTGPQTLGLLSDEIRKAKYILWNGPLGAYEDGYVEPTLFLARSISSVTKNNIKTIVGGGDTLAAIAKLGIEQDFTFVSTGGGAMLDFLSEGSLPGIKALEKAI